MRLTKQQWATIAICLTCLGLVGGALWRFSHRRIAPVSFTPAKVITISTDTPDEEPPRSTTYQWQGKATDPKKLMIGSIGVNAFIQQVGVDQHQQIAVPGNIHMAGWFVQSVLPGQPGLSIIDGHVNGVTADAGVFKRLTELEVGDTAQIIYGDDTVTEFEVVISQSLPTDQAAAVLYSQQPGIESQLNLITCTGTFDRSARAYDQRHIVVLKKL